MRPRQRFTTFKLKSEERSKMVKSWFRFAFECVSLEIRSKKSKLFLKVRGKILARYPTV